MRTSRADEADGARPELWLDSVVTLPGAPTASPMRVRFARRWLLPEHHPDMPVTDVLRGWPDAPWVLAAPLGWVLLLVGVVIGLACCSPARAAAPHDAVAVASGPPAQACGERLAVASWPAVARGVRGRRDPLVATLPVPVIGGDVTGEVRLTLDGILVDVPGLSVTVERADGGPVEPRTDEAPSRGARASFQTSAEEGEIELVARVKVTAGQSRRWLKRSCGGGACSMEFKVEAAFEADVLARAAVDELSDAWRRVGARFRTHDGTRVNDTLAFRTAERELSELKRTLSAKSCPLPSVQAALDQALVAVQGAHGVATGLFANGPVPEGAARRALDAAAGLVADFAEHPDRTALWTGRDAPVDWQDDAVLGVLRSVEAIDAAGLEEVNRRVALAWARVFASHDAEQLTRELKGTGGLDPADPLGDLAARQRTLDQIAKAGGKAVEILPAWLPDSPKLAVAVDFPVGSPPFCLGADGSSLVGAAAPAMQAVLVQAGLDADGLHLRSLQSLRDDLGRLREVEGVLCEVPVHLDLLGQRGRTAAELVTALDDLSAVTDWREPAPKDTLARALAAGVRDAACQAVSLGQARAEGGTVEGVKGWYDAANALIRAVPGWPLQCPDGRGARAPRTIPSIQADAELVFSAAVHRVDAPGARPRAVEKAFGPLPDQLPSEPGSAALLLPVPVPFDDAEIRRMEAAACSGGSLCADLASVIGDARLGAWFPGRSCNRVEVGPGPGPVTLGGSAARLTATLPCPSRDYTWEVTITRDAGRVLRLMSNKPFSVDGRQAGCGTGTCAWQRDLTAAGPLRLRVHGSAAGQTVAITTVGAVR
jgi:hypothetical protein